MHRIALLVALATACAFAGAKEDTRPPDTFSRALAEMGIDVLDLGYRPQAHWARYPHPAKVPFVLPFFSDLHARPLDTYEFTRSLGNAVEDLLTPEALMEKEGTLFKLGVILATDHRIGGFRGYGANLDPRPAREDPLHHALIRLIDRSGTEFRQDASFGKKADNSVDPFAELRSAVDAVPAALHLPLARLILNLIDAKEWIDRGLRRVPIPMREEVFRVLPDLAESTGDGTRFFPVIEDVARLVDEPSLYYGCLKALQAVQDARRELAASPAPEAEFELRLSTAWGTVLLDNTPSDRRQVTDPLLMVLWAGSPLAPPAGASGPRRPLSLALLMDSGTIGEGSESGDRIASGILGCGIVYAAGGRPNSWTTGHWGLGAGLFGLGALIDEGGDDEYAMASVGQGAGYFGAGLLLDAEGNDTYSLSEGDGQGIGFPGGIGVLADRSGDDEYFSEPDAAKAGRADYHSKHEVAVSNAQGVGSGRRGDGSDGHVWAGGLGALIDVDGDDEYRAGNFSQGLGYWYGTGLLWDGAGDDEYRSVYFTQGSGAHFAIGALIDESGDDTHVLAENAGAAFGFGWDAVNAFLIDRGSGNDRYEAKIISTGLAEVRSNAFFLDEGGDDTYLLNAGTLGYGDVDHRDNYLEPGRTSAYFFHLSQVAVFLDLGGEDTYLRRGKDGASRPDRAAADGKTWNLERRDPAALNGPNVSVGMDVESGRLGFLDAWPARLPPKPEKRSKPEGE